MKEKKAYKEYEDCTRNVVDSCRVNHFVYSALFAHPK